MKLKSGGFKQLSNLSVLRGEPEPQPLPSDESYIGQLAPRLRVDDGNVAAQVVRCLVDAGVRTGFGIPGGPIAPLFVEAVAHPNFELVESRTETAAAFAAASYHRATGQTPVLLVTAGPGITNAITGIASASCERVPMLVLCGDVSWAGGRRLLQDSGPNGLDAEQLVASITRRQTRILSSASVLPEVTEALAVSRGEVHPGPVLVVIPTEQSHKEADPAPEIEALKPTASTTIERSIVKQVASRLAEAERPLLVLGAGARPASAQIRSLVDTFGIPFVTTPQAKGLVSEHHPRSLRHGGLAASLWAREYTRRGVDATLVLGTDLDDCSIGATAYGGDGWLAHVDLNAGVFNRNLQTELGVCCDLGAFSEALTHEVAARGLTNSRARRELREIKAGSAFETLSSQGDNIRPDQAIEELQGAFPSARFITDIGEHMLTALHYFTASHPEHFHIHLGLGSMGSGIGGSIGLGVADPHKTVVCVCGDGSMQMTGMELLVARDRNLPIVFAVFNDARYNMVHHGIKQLYGANVGYETGTVDFVAWARALGIPGYCVTSSGGIQSGLSNLWNGDGPLMIDIRIDREVRLQGGGRLAALARMSRLESVS